MQVVLGPFQVLDNIQDPRLSIIWCYNSTVSPRKWRILGLGKKPPFLKSAICEVVKQY